MPRQDLDHRDASGQWESGSSGSGLSGNGDGLSGDEGEKMAAETAPAPQAGTALKAEEVVRLHDELVALKLHNQDLLELRKRMQARVQGQGAGGDATAGAAAAAPKMARRAAAQATAFALGSTLRSKVRANADAVTAGVRRKTAGAQKTLSPVPAISRLRRSHSPMAPNASTAEPVKGGSAVLQIEADSLRRQIRATLEEVNEADAAAKEVQKAASSSGIPSWLPKPEAIREKLLELRRESAGREDSLELLDFVDDQLLQRVAHATVQLARRSPAAAAASLQQQDQQPRRDVAAPESEPCEAAAKESDGSNADHILLQRKIEAQQDELDKLLEIKKRGSADITRLRDEIESGLGMKKTNTMSKEAKNLAKEKLRETEKHLEGLTRQLQDADEAKEQVQVLLAQLKGALEQASQLGRSTVEMQENAGRQTEETRTLHERLHLLQEDLHGQRERRHRAAAWKRLRRRTHISAVAPAAAPESRSVPASSSSNIVVGSGTVSATSRRPSSLAVSTRELGTQATLASGSLQAICERQRLRTEIEDLRIEKALLEKRMARDLQELRGLLLSAEEPRQVLDLKLKEEAETVVAEEPNLDSPDKVEEVSSPVKTVDVFLVDNRFLQASTPGLGFRSSPSLADMDKDHALVKWGSKVGGVLLEDAEVPDGITDCPGGWLRVGDRFLPTHLEGIPVLRACGTEARRRVSTYDISSDGEGSLRLGYDSDSGDSTPPEPYPAGLLYVQRIEELEQIGDWLRRDLSEIHERDRSLRAENKEKNELIMHLMRKAKLTELPTNEDSARRHVWAAGSIEDLERIIEETTQDNIRLRNDLQVMAGELRKALATADASLVSTKKQ